ncbi:MAG: hypothetical protein ACRC1H_00205, partial [Caldilineaceae bacterium]
MSRKNGASRLIAATTHARQQSTYLLVILLFLTSIVLPVNAHAQSAPLIAPDAAGPCSSAALAAGAPLADGIVQPASPDAPVLIPKAVVDRAVFVAYWRNRYADAEALDSLMQSLFLVAGGGAALPQLNSAVRVRIPVDEINDRVKHPLEKIVYAYLDAAFSIPALVPLLPDVWNTLHAGAPGNAIAVESSLLIAQSAQQVDLGERMLQNAQEYMVAIHDCARRNQAFAAQFDSFHAPSLGAGIGDSAATLLQKGPDFTLPTVLAQGIQPNGTLLISLNQVNDMGAGGLSELNATMDVMVAAAKEIDQKQTDVVAYNNDEQKKKEAKELAKKTAEETEKKFKKAEATINATTIILKQLDPKLAGDFKTVTSSYLSIVKAVNSWLEDTVGDGAFDKIFSFSTVIMTGNVLGAVMDIVGMFGEDKPTPEQKILEEIGKLRQQVNQLRQEMHTRFDRIDAQLNTIFTTMQARFDQVDIQLGRINGNIRDVQRSLIELDLRLSQFERNNFELLNVLGRRPLLDAINSGLDYQRITGSAMPFQPEFVGFERTFHTWGTVHAFDPLNTGPSQRDYSDGALLRELTTYPLDTNL